MISLRSGEYKKDDYIALYVLLKTNFFEYINCPDRGKDICTSCWCYKPCRDISSLYGHISEKIK